MAETSTAQAADGSIKTASPQQNPKPKSEHAKDSESDAPKRKSPVTSKAKVGQPERNAQGTIVTKWMNPDQDPNLRKHVGEDPTGESNSIKGPE